MAVTTLLTCFSLFLKHEKTLLKYLLFGEIMWGDQTFKFQTCPGQKRLKWIKSFANIEQLWFGHKDLIFASDIYDNGFVSS